MTTPTLIGYKAASDLASKLSFFVVVVVAARRLDRETFGLFSLALALGWILSVATDFGLQLHVNRAIARSPEHARAVLRPFLRLRLGTAAGAAAVAAPLSFALAGPLAPSFFFIVVAQVTSSLVEFLNYAYRGLARSEIESSLNLAQRLATLGAALGLLAWRPSLAALALALLVPAVTTLAASAAVAGRLLESPGPGERPGAPIVTLARRDLARDVVPIGAALVLSALYFRIDVFLIERWSGVESVALYNAVFRLVEALRLFPAAVLAVVFPMLCRARTLRPLAFVAAGLSLCGVAAAVVTWSLAPWVVRVCYGDAYLAAVPAFRALAAAVPLFFLNYALTHQLVGWDAQARYARISGLALLANLVANAWLLPRLGIVGAAWATVSTEVVVTGACALALASVTPRRPAVRVPIPAVS